ncbi:unnamed protein product [Caenorhabditis bovis]|uniref:Uncharacterized protein n=1 Tax=Caenorhabditis bovis TaxID=2654633 RepID=A0A8S1F1M9_9PELO|nr:unnamed protein product [Caenorhabditis bovis]
MHAFFQGLGMGMPSYAGRFDVNFAAYGAVFLETATQEKTEEIDNGGKILLPTSALDMLLRMNIQYPMLFKLTNPRHSRVTHAGVLEFSAPEGQAIIPHWMMIQLGLDDGETVHIETATLQKATFAKLKPMTLEFLNITNPKAFLEVELRKYACLTKGDRIPTSYAGQTVEFLVVDVKPANAVCIIECDLNLDFDTPEGYVEQPKAATTAPAVSAKPPAPPASAFTGVGQTVAGGQTIRGKRLDSSRASESDAKKKTMSTSSSDAAMASSEAAGGAADGGELPALPPVLVNEDYRAGRLSFVRYDYKRLDVLQKEIREREQQEKLKSTNIYKGASQTLRSCR